MNYMEFFWQANHKSQSKSFGLFSGSDAGKDIPCGQTGRFVQTFTSLTFPILFSESIAEHTFDLDEKHPDFPFE